jgi:hypothetical protein
MATKTLYWGDGTSDRITVDFSGNGDDRTLISSDPNTKPAGRSRQITFSGAGVIRKVTLSQQPAPGDYNNDYSNDYNNNNN